MKLNSRTAVLLFLLSLSSFAFLTTIGCQTTERSKETTERSKELNLAVPSGVEGDALKAAAIDYSKSTGVKVSVNEFPYDDLFAKEMVDLNARSGAYDLVMLDDPWFPRFAGANLLTDLTSLYQARGLSGPDEDFIATSLALCREPYKTGALLALPYVGNSQLFFYRADLFQKHGLRAPESWDDVLVAAKTINEKETRGSPDGGRVYGYVMRAARGNSAVADFMPIFWAFGAEMFDENEHATVNSPEAIEALKFMLELGKYSPPGYASYNATEVSAHLLQGTSAMSINWPAWIGAFSDPSKSRVQGKVVFTTLPRGKKPGQAEIGNWLIGIPTGSRNAQSAFDFLVWVTSADQMKKSALAGNPPTRRSVFNDPELRERFSSYPAQLESLETSRPRPRTGLWNQIENAFGIFLSQANTGELSPEDALNQANRQIEKIIEQSR